MKVIVSKELKSRLRNAALNGSIVAKDILTEINSNADVSQIIRGGANYFNSKRTRSSGDDHYSRIKVSFTACKKDITNENFPDRGNPEAPWFKENRTDLDPSTFVKCFTRLPEYDDTDMDYFANAICVNSRVTVKLYDRMRNFIDAYNGENYCPSAQAGESTLHNSCMRHETSTRNAADFYYHFAGAKIIIATDASHNVLGRAVIWPKAFIVSENVSVPVSVIDRVYYSHSFVMKMILNHAESIGINLRKKYNDRSHPNDFVVLNPIEGVTGEKGNCIFLKLRIEVPASKWHKTGAPYLDTFQYVRVFESGEKWQLELVNWESSRRVAYCQHTEGYAELVYKFCPSCGKIHHDSNQILCDECYNKLTVKTFMGRFLIGKTINYKGKTYPACLIRKGRPTPLLALYLNLQKLYK